MPAGHPDDAFLRAAAERMRERFAIGHVTLQAATETLMTPCDGAVVGARRAGDPLALSAGRSRR